MSTSARIYDRSQFVNGDVFWDVTDKLRVGLDLSWFEQTYVDGVSAHNTRVQWSSFYLLGLAWMQDIRAA